MKNRMSLVILFTLLPLILIIYLYKNQKVGLYLPFYRKYNSGILKYNKKFALDFNDPYRIRANDYSLFIYSLENGLLFQLDSSGNLIKKILKGKNAKFNLIINYTANKDRLNILDERRREFYSINISSDSVIETKPLFPFLRGLPLNLENLFLATINIKTHGINFLKYQNLSEIDTLDFPLDKVYDGGFANDGFFCSYDSSANKLGYILYHTGNFVLFDSSGKKLYRYHTIDNYQKLPIVAMSGINYTLSRKSVTINRTAAINHNYLFIVSNVKSKEDKRNNINADIIDLYEIENGKYLCSFIVKNINEHIIDIFATESKLYALTKQNVIEYNIIK